MFGDRFRHCGSTIIFLACAVSLLWADSPDARVRPSPRPILDGSARIVDAVPGVRRIEPINTPEAGVFQLVLDAPPDTMSRAWLVYELAGAPHWTAAVRSINGFPADGGFSAKPSAGTELQIEEINPRWLQEGVNRVLFSPARAFDDRRARLIELQRPERIIDTDPDSVVAYTVRNLRLMYIEGPAEPTPHLRLSHPLNGETDNDGALLRGFVDPPSLRNGRAELFINAVYLPEGIDPSDGSFSVFVPRTVPVGKPWTVDIEVVYPDGSRLHQKVQLAAENESDEEGGEDVAELETDGRQPKSFGLEEARLDVTAGALRRKVKLTMRRLRSEELAALDAGMTNVTPQRRGFRLGPHGLRFDEPVRLRLPYDPDLLPKGMTPADIRTFYFDEEAGRWFALPRVTMSEGDETAIDAKAGGHAIISATDHFTDFINATIALPDAPSGENYAPNSMRELAKADPASAIVQIESPEGGPTGDAMLDFPLVVPAGRRGMQPELTVQYNSASANGWLGVGWDLRLPSIEISTLFGVPRYDGTDRYLIDGEQLASTSSAGVYVRRAERNFDRIVRHGSNPASYWWEVTDKNGTRSIYGRSAQARLRDPNSGNTFRWYLEQVIDLHGNSVDHSYFTEQGSDGERWTEVYPARIDYTGHGGTGAFYHVVFTLDAGDRPDRLSSGRPGFKTYTRRRLNSVDVLAGSEVVRRYLFRYRQGDFQKSLLTSIAVTGEGGAAELYRHSFDYYAMATDSSGGYNAFAPQQAWSGIGTGSDFTDSLRAGGGAHGFAGLGPPSCQPHAGIQLGGAGVDTTQSVTFVDVNGDGLPDRLDDDGDVRLNAYLPAADPDGTRAGGFASAHFDNATTIGHTSEWSLDFGVGVHAELGITAALDANWVWAHANDDRLVTDVNGDYRPDLVSTNGGFSVLVNNGRSFVSQANWSGFSSQGLTLTSADEESEVLSRFRLANPLRQLLLPFSGRVTLSGAIQKKEATGDGVDVAIYHNSNLVWSRRFAGNETAACVPGPANSCNGGLSLAVNGGDSLYLLAGAVRDTSADALLWAPVVSYDGQDAQAKEPYGARTFVFDAREDFALAGYRGVSWTAPASGNIRINGSLVKQETSDDVTVTVTRRRGFVEQVFFTRTFAATESATLDAVPATIDVARGDLLFLRLSSRTAVDPKRIQWTPSVTYEGSTEPALPDNVRTQRVPVSMPIPDLLPSNEATRSWTATSTGEQSINISCEAGSVPSGTFYLQAVNRLLATRAAAEHINISGQATAGEPLFVTLLATGPVSAGTCRVNGGSIPLNVRWPAPDRSLSVLSGGHHGWFHGEWNGNLPFNASRLVPPSSQNDDPDFVAGTPRWEGANGFVAPAWTAAGFDLYLAAEGVKPSRKGANAAGVLDQAAGTTAGGGLSVLRKTTSRTAGVSAGAGIGLSLSTGTSDTDLDIIDMNGDRYPDQVSADGVRFSNGTNGFGSLQTFPGLTSSVRESEDINASTSIGLGINFTRKNGKGEATAVVNTLPSVASAVALTQTTSDLIDVNGDGLPDRVSMEPGESSMTVRLNLGYRFGAEETWSLPSLNDDGRCEDVIPFISSKLAGVTGLDTLNAISFTRSSVLQGGIAIGPFGGGASTTLARTLVELVDVNGDGLADRVAKDGSGAFRVQLNLGDRWAQEQRWSAPNWSASIGDGYNPGQIFQCLDAVTFTGHVEVQGSIGVPICIPLVPPTPVAGLQIEISGQGFGSTSSGLQLLLDDLDGDGLADHVLKKTGDGNVYVKRNQSGKVNLLKSVQRPLGSTVEISYERRGNHVNMPFNQWVLSAVSVSDGRGTPLYVTRYAYGNDAFYDRDERETYGYASLRVTLPDGSTIDRNFLNGDLYTRHLKTKEVLRNAVGDLFRVETSHYELQPAAGSAMSRFAALTSETTSFYEGTTRVEAAAPKSTSVSYEYDSLGNVVRTVDVADTGVDDDVRTAITYQFDPNTRLTRPATLEVRDGRDRLLRSRIAAYNTAGDVTRLEKVLIGGRDPETGSTYSGGKNAVWTFTYDEVGNLVSSVDPSQYTSTSTYDTATRTYPVEVRDSFGYVTRYAWNLKHGQVTETTDQNNNSIRRAYDAFGRLSRVIGPYDDDAAPTLSFEYGPGAPISWAVVRHKDATRSDTIDSAVFIDSLERVLQRKEDAELDQGSGASTRSGMRVSGRVAFDAKGRVSAEGQPVFDERPANQFVDVPLRNATSFAYDALDRIASVRFPYNNAATSVGYRFGTLDGTLRLLTVRTDPAGRTTLFYRDVNDNTVGVEQTNTIGGARRTLITRYAYDALNQLVSVADAKANTTRLAYDTLGRKVTLENPDAGLTELRYDPAGNLRATITANLAAGNQQIRYLYTFNRLDRIDYPQSPDVAYTYGGPGASFNRANRIATVVSESGLEERSYGKLGEVVQTVKTVSALNGNTPKGPYVTRFQFDSFERLLSVVYPDGETLTYGYDGGGHLKSATGLLKGVRFDYLRHLGYDEFGERARMVLGNGAETRYTYDAASRFLTQLRTTAGGRELQNLRYQYDLTETLLAMQNDVPVPAPSLYGGPVSASFRYDDLVQLISAQGTYQSGPNKTSAYTLALSYDEIGNIVAKNQRHQSGSGNKLNDEKKTSYEWAYNYAGPQPHAPTRIGERAFRYDLDGNQIGWESDANGTRRTLSWNEENRLTAVADNGQTTRFLYDADGTRSSKAGPHGETIYVNRWFSLRNGAIASKHVFADETRLATKVSPDPDPPSEKVYFFQADRLGSTQFVTDESATIFQHLEYFPSGEAWVDERSETQRTPYLFSGKELDEETGLSYFGHRYYDSRQGQWISADPILDEMLDAAKLRAGSEGFGVFHLPGEPFGYVSNDPLNNSDPDGLARLQISKQGRAFEVKLKRRLTSAKKKGLIADYKAQVRVRAAGVISILDFVVLKNNNQKVVLEAKSSETAPLTKNQKLAFAQIRAAKQYVRESGGAPVAIKKISIVRPKTLDKKGVFERLLNN